MIDIANDGDVNYVYCTECELRTYYPLFALHEVGILAAFHAQYVHKNQRRQI